MWLWSDNRVALTWVSNSKEFKDVNVASWVDQVQFLQSKFNFTLKHILTRNNPGDLITKSCSVKTLKGSMWKRGQERLVTQNYPSQDIV